MSKMVIFVLRYVHAVILGMSPGSLDVHYEVSYGFFAIHFLTPQTHLDIRISPSFNSGSVLQIFPFGAILCLLSVWW